MADGVGPRPGDTLQVVQPGGPIHHKIVTAISGAAPHPNFPAVGLVVRVTHPDWPTPVPLRLAELEPFQQKRHTTVNPKHKLKRRAEQTELPL
jgi:hypothetical protein